MVVEGRRWQVGGWFAVEGYRGSGCCFPASFLLHGFRFWIQISPISSKISYVRYIERKLLQTKVFALGSAMFLLLSITFFSESLCFLEKTPDLLDLAMLRVLFVPFWASGKSLPKRRAWNGSHPAASSLTVPSSRFA